jgi:hypothetical protein
MIACDEPLTIQDSVDESEPFAFGWELCPFNERYRVKGDEGRAKLEISSFGFRANALNAKSLLYGQGSVLLRRQVKTGIVKAMEVASPT